MNLSHVPIGDLIRSLQWKDYTNLPEDKAAAISAELMLRHNRIKNCFQKPKKKLSWKEEGF